MTGIERIAAERQRQIEEEGWDACHDDDHDCEELAWAAVHYAAPDEVRRQRPVWGDDSFTEPAFPRYWDSAWDKKGDADRIRDLEKAGALVAAEIDRLLREQERDNALRANWTKACVKCGEAVTCDAFEAEPTCISCQDGEEQSK